MTSNVIPTPSNPWFGVAMVLIGLVVGYGAATTMGVPMPSSGGGDTVKEAPKAPTPKPTPTGTVTPVDVDEDNIRGDKNATVSVIEYSDFECPFCGRVHPNLKALIDEVDDVNWVYRHYPLGFHSNAQKSAEASECAADQGKFWEYADMLFDKGADIAKLSGYARELGLDIADFETCLNDGKHAQKVKDQMATGSAAGIRGTPGNIVINNKTEEYKLVSGAQALEAFKNAVESVR